MMKSVWVINHYASSPDTGMGGRSFYLAQGLHEIGHATTLIAAHFNHKLFAPRSFSGLFNIDRTYGFAIARIKVFRYRFSSSKLRIVNWFVFLAALLVFHRQLASKPDVIICSSPSLITFLAARRLSAIYNCNLVLDIRDLWPLTLRNLGGYSQHNPLIYLLQKIEDYAYKASDLVISNLPFAWKHMRSRGMPKNKFRWLPNGVNATQMSEPEPVPENIRSQMPCEKFVIGYTGSVSSANAIDTLLEAAFLLKDDESLAFVVVGKGKEKKSLQEKAATEGLANVYFLDPVKKSQIQDMLTFFDVCFIGWKKEGLYEYGISPNKIPDYFLARKPVLHSFSGQGDPVELAKAGITVPAESSSAVADAVIELKSMTREERARMGNNGYEYALANLEYSILSRRLSRIVEEELK